MKNNNDSDSVTNDFGVEMYNWAKELFPLNRSLTGVGNRETLKYIAIKIGIELSVKSFKTGEKCFDWIIPEEWNINEAYIETLEGERLIDFKENNLHVVGYSIGVDRIMSRDDLFSKLHVHPTLDNAIPYLTTYYSKDWGFCLSREQKEKFTEEFYKVKIDAFHFDGELNYGEFVIKGKVKEEVVFSTYICHPSMANNELSGIVMSMELIKLINSRSNYYTYRFLFIPETIGAIAYISANEKKLKENVIAGFVLTCLGDENVFSFMPTKYENTYVDKLALFVLDNYVNSYKKYTFLERGSDERQFCSPNVDLPFVSIMKSKYKEYEQYHTSLDNLDFISQKGLSDTFNLYSKLLNVLEKNFVVTTKLHCEPMLSKRDLYPTIGGAIKGGRTKLIKNILAYADGKNDLIDLSIIFGINIFDEYEIVEQLLFEGLIDKLRS